MFRALSLTGLTLIFTFTSNHLHAKTVEISSPNQQINVSISDDGTPNYRVDFAKENVLNKSRLGLRFKQTEEFGEGFKISNVQRYQADNIWQQPWGEQQNIHDNYQAIDVLFSNSKHQFSVQFKVYNDGIGFRYKVPKQQGLSALDITNELTEFAITPKQKATAWWIPARRWNRYEYIYQTTPLEQVAIAHTPFTLKLDSGTHISIHEATLVDYAGMSLNQQRYGVLKADLAPWSDGILVKTNAGFHSPWRTIQLSKDAKGLANSSLILNLNEPNKLGDVSWVKPGKYVGIWWGMHLAETTWASGDKHGATTAETKRYMDFAAKYGFDGVLVEGWNLGWDGSWFDNGDLFNFSKSFADFDLAAVTEYGKNKGVKLIGHHETSGSVTNYHRQMEDAYTLYEQNGVSQVKTGYVADGGNITRIDEQGIKRHEWHDGQFMVNEYLASVQLAAKHHISINTHEPIKDTGLRRTYPNWISREGARGQEYNAWGNPSNPPEHTTILPFTRMLAGPMDFTPGIFNLGFHGLTDNVSRPKTTLAKQLALYVVLYSPIQMAADLPRNYEANLPAFQFIRDVTTDWQESKMLAGEIGDYVVFARKAKANNDWFLGALTDENAREITIKLDFLTQGKHYQAQIYRDGKKANWITKPYDMIIEQKEVSANDTLTLPLATSGGAAIRFKLLK
jgi:alpha-glucosidase